MSPASQSTTGLDQLIEDPALLDSSRAGLLTHFAATTTGLERGVDALLTAGIGLRCLISPEHGYWGTGQAGEGSNEKVDAATGLPVLDSYRVHGADLDRLIAGSGIDRVVVDLRDIGCRFYTYIWSMAEVMDSCARLGLPVTVLDRPAPLSAAAVGPGLDPACSSFVGRLGIPLRHGTRIGRIAEFIARSHLAGPLDLQVITAPGADGTGPWVAPSPNMPTLTTVALYPGTGLLEGTTLSEGRGTTRPFELIGAPWCGPELAAHLRELALPGVAFREAVYRPTHSTFAGERVHGVQVHLALDPQQAGDLRVFDPLRVGYTVIAAVRALYPGQRLWRERTDGRPPFIDLLWGSPAFREGIEEDAGYDEILAASPTPLDVVA